MNQIAVVNPSGQLVLTSKDGSHSKIITDGSILFQFPAWSPDGRSIAALGRHRHPGRGGGSIFIYDVEKDQTFSREVYSSPSQIPFYLYWSPDSRYLSFLATHPRAGMGLHYLSADYGPSQLLHLGQPFFWSWGPKGSEILIHTGGSSVSAELSFLKPEYPFDHQPISLGTPGHFQTPGISPSARYVAFGIEDEANRPKLIIEDRHDRSRVSIKYKGAAVFSWSPAKDYLAYISPTDSIQHFYGMLRLVDPQNGHRRVLVEEDVVAFFWSPDGRRIAYFTPVEPIKNLNEIPMIQSGYAKGKPLPDDSIFNLWLNLSVVDIYTGQIDLLTPFKPNPVFVNQFLPFFDQYALSHRLWSPDSDALVLPVMIGDEPKIANIPINQAPPFYLGDGIMASWRQGPN